MTEPLVEIEAVVKAVAGPQPLRITRFRVERGDRYTLSGFDAGAAEAFVHLVTGAMLPDEGDVRITGASTRAITTDTAWLESLDRFGLVSARAVLIEKLTIADNLALPLTLAIDPIPDDVRPKVERLADEVGLARARLSAAADSLSPLERVQVHLARAIATDPALLLFEHPTSAFDATSAASLGATLQRVADARGLGWIVLAQDERFAKAVGGKWLRWDPRSGEFKSPGVFSKWFR